MGKAMANVLVVEGPAVGVEPGAVRATDGDGTDTPTADHNRQRVHGWGYHVLSAAKRFQGPGFSAGALLCRHGRLTRPDERSESGGMRRRPQ